MWKLVCENGIVCIKDTGYFLCDRKLPGVTIKETSSQARKKGSMTMELLKIRELRKVYGTGETQVKALDGINLTVERGEFVAIVGSSGSGKTTFLNMVGGLDIPTSGEIIVDQKEIQKLSDDELTVFRRRKIGFIFQQYNLIQMLSVWENVILPLKLDGRRVDEEYILAITKMLGLHEKLNCIPNQLSGGQQQRAAIARALATKPAIILADEPTGNLDSKTSQDVLGLLKITSNKFNQTIIMITHNEEIAQLADRILRIEDGKIQKESKLKTIRKSEENTMTVIE